MTDLRDARLRQALDQAPDAGLRPLPRTREAVLAAARAQAAPSPWWKRLWAPAPGASRMPWNAAFATLLVAGFVSVLWQGQEVPDARPERAARPAPVVAPKARDASPQEKEAVPEKKEAAPPGAGTGAVVAEGAARAAPSSKLALPHSTPTQSAKAATSADLARAPRERGEGPTVAAQQALPQAARAELAKQSAREETRAAAPLQDHAAAPSAPAAQAPETPRPAAPVRAAAAPVAPMPAPAAAAAPPVPRLSAPGADAAAGSSLQRREFNEPGAAGPWTHLQIEGAGKLVLLARADALRLALDAERVLRAPPATVPFAEEAEFRVRLLDGERQAGVLTIGRSQLGWTPGGEPGAVRSLAPDPALVELRAELERRLR